MMQQQQQLDLDDRAWTAILTRDATWDGRVVYAVTTTGVFCRPSCPARRPRRANVELFPSPGDARRAGYRPCRRCDPESAGMPDDGIVDAALDRIHGGLERAAPFGEVAAALGVSAPHLQRRFRAGTGMTPKDCATLLRLARFRARVRAGDGVATATYASGFGSSRGLYTAARRMLGMTPGRYARGGAGLAVDCAFAETSLGRTLVATTSAGVCAVFLGERDEDLAADLARELPAADIASRGVRRAWVDAVLRHLDDTRSPIAVPIDYRGTPFQVRVWRALREIPVGATRTYAEIASGLEAPRAARAVGRACALNSVAVLVPCHRVVRGDGGLGGYRWGAARKAALLERERD